MIETRAAIRQRLENAWLRLDVDGRPLDVWRIRPEQIGNLYHVAALSAMARHYHLLAADLAEWLEQDPAGREPAAQTALASLRRCRQVAEPATFAVVKQGTVTLIEGLADAEYRGFCQEALAASELALGYKLGFAQAVTWMTAKADEALDALHGRGMAGFRRLQPVLQTLMGRPSGAEIEAAIDEVEQVQDELDQLFADFGVYLRALGIEPEHQPDPRLPLTTLDNQRNLERLQDFLEKCLPDYPDEVDRLSEAVLRGASILQTNLTAIRQIDHSFDRLGVTAG